MGCVLLDDGLADVRSLALSTEGGVFEELKKEEDLEPCRHRYSAARNKNSLLSPRLILFELLTRGSK